MRKEACGGLWQAGGYVGLGTCLACIDSLTRGIDSGTRGGTRLATRCVSTKLLQKTLTKNPKTNDLGHRKLT